MSQEYLSKRECIILTPKDLLSFDNETINDLNDLENHRIYLNGEKILYFLDIADEKLLNKLVNYQVNKVYRLDDFYLKIMYDFEEKSEGIKPTKKFINYYKSRPSEKLDTFYELLLRNMPQKCFQRNEHCTL